MGTNKTLAYYNTNAHRFTSDPLDVDFSDIQDSFLAQLKPGALILDFGCGSGRDTAYFREKGLTVDAADGSSEMCRLASEYLQTPVACMEFNELDAEDLYDGIWASASIMHLEYEKLKEVFPKMIRALKKNGILYVNFKYGDKDGFLGKRYYTYMTEERFQDLLKDFPQLTAVETGTFGNEHPDQPDFRWLYAYLRKTE